MRGEPRQFGPRLFTAELHHQNEARDLSVGTNAGVPAVGDEWTIPVADLMPQASPGGPFPRAAPDRIQPGRAGEMLWGRINPWVVLRVAGGISKRRAGPGPASRGKTPTPPRAIPRGFCRPRCRIPGAGGAGLTPERGASLRAARSLLSVVVALRGGGAESFRDRLELVRRARRAGRTWRNWYTQQTLTIGVPGGKPPVQNRSNSGKANGPPGPTPIPSQARGQSVPREGVETGRAVPVALPGNRMAMAKGQSSPRTAPERGRRRKPKWDENLPSARNYGFKSRRPHHPPARTSLPRPPVRERSAALPGRLPPRAFAGN
ncbi:hypothetical protein XINFAN_03766 [Pseudogemmobacter humi]|uniref:Uncharacterized protein n=1 Tax=Pseudogemmobacter humi TaxID=2483812 RepID=A0A3P5XVX1_9RHOB|nr:hypothetical protein XINFAN_03766 [Pseudogemmobacter humi]